MFLFVPVYPLYYVISRWSECKRPFLICIWTWVLALGGVGLIVLSSYVSNADVEDDQVRVEQSYSDCLRI